MSRPVTFVCGDATVSPSETSRKQVRLSTTGAHRNVNLRIGDVARVVHKTSPPRLVDLLEIASYVFAADTSEHRGNSWTNQGASERWGRDYELKIPVEDLAFWKRKDISELLSHILGFLSDDKFRFTFKKLKSRPGVQEFLDFGDFDDWPFRGIDRVTMFSGGLDSLAGVVESAARGENQVLVSHRPVATTDKRQRDLFSRIREEFQVPMIHVPVVVNKGKTLGREATQRTRSFLFSALGAFVAHAVQSKGVRFYENGVVSLNLPVADEVVGARASRTTHPYVLELFSTLYSHILEQDFIVDNPYLFCTKAEVLSKIGNAGVSELIHSTCSCAHTMFKGKSQWHCGTCSQCIDRRTAILAAGLSEFDNDHDYEVDVFTGPRSAGYEQNMAVNYARHGLELANMTERKFALKFSLELTRALTSRAKRIAADDLVALHKRHGEGVKRVLTDQIRLNAESLLNGELDPTSLLAMVLGQKHLNTTWMQFASRVSNILKNAIPTIASSDRPRNEPQLQKWCDGVLQSHDLDLDREFPFMRWASALTKPDWSKNDLSLWIELKYARTGRSKAQITDDIAADITKYGDNGARVLFVVYDPDGIFVANEEELRNSIEKHTGMILTVIR